MRQPEQRALAPELRPLATQSKDYVGNLAVATAAYIAQICVDPKSHERQVNEISWGTYELCASANSGDLGVHVEMVSVYMGSGDCPDDPADYSRVDVGVHGWGIGDNFSLGHSLVTTGGSVRGNILGPYDELPLPDIVDLCNPLNNDAPPEVARAYDAGTLTLQLVVAQLNARGIEAFSNLRAECEGRPSVVVHEDLARGAQLLDNYVEFVAPDDQISAFGANIRVKDLPQHPLVAAPWPLTDHQYPGSNNK